ncbi:NAD(P)/FAD-dependent oxidoreductase [uncultured Aeromicrobium sp.]|uniref:phytoene desaturase family protein n=1 Tax=uncultured Aeromicrobium sp. TaxID=337820 RepID=UPI0026000558|nr:FAD-dependent oxidoreductase [uncultured Aeromicrobium sp.]
MARVVIVGGGFAGLTVASRLAKLRHQVTVLEAADSLGGRLRGLVWQDHVWHLTPQTVTLPGVFRDFFRKSGRTMDRVIDITPAGPRRHIIVRGRHRDVLDLPFGTRSAQHDAVVRTFGADSWSPWVDSLGPVWDGLRRRMLDEVYDGGLERPYRRLLQPRRSVRQAARLAFRDRRLRALVLDPIRLAGDDPAHTPAYTSVWHYAERNFGRWTFAGGPSALADALERRLLERKVETVRSCRATDVQRVDGTVRGVVTEDGVIEADIVVWCAPELPRSYREPSLMRRIPAPRSLLVLHEPPDLPEEVIVHAQLPVRLWRSGPRHWVAESRAGGDILDVLAAAGVDWRRQVTARRDLTPRELVGLGHDGWAWRDWRAARERPGVGARQGLFFAGAHAHPGSALELIGLATAAIATHLGEVPRR